MTERETTRDVGVPDADDAAEPIASVKLARWQIVLLGGSLVLAVLYRIISPYLWILPRWLLSRPLIARGVL